MKTRRRAAFAGLIAALAACSSPVASDPRPGFDPGRSIDSALPSRPREITINDLDPCRVFAPQQLEKLDVGGSRYTAADGERGPTCQWSHSPNEPLEGYLVESITTFGAAAALQNPLGASVISVAGYAAVETLSITAPRDKSCQILLDVAADQTLQVGYSYNGDTLPMTRGLACEKARFAAELAMQTLIGQTGGG